VPISLERQSPWEALRNLITVWVWNRRKKVVSGDSLAEGQLVGFHQKLPRLAQSMAQRGASSLLELSDASRPLHPTKTF